MLNFQNNLQEDPQSGKKNRDYSDQLNGYKGDAPLAHSILNKGLFTKDTLMIAKDKVPAPVCVLVVCVYMYTWLLVKLRKCNNVHATRIPACRQRLSGVLVQATLISAYIGVIVQATLISAYVGMDSHNQTHALV